MQTEPNDPHRIPQRGAEGWVPPLLIAIANIALVIALVWFIVVARSLYGRIPVPPWLIPLAIIAAAGVAAHLLIRGVWHFRAARRGWLRRFEPSKPR
jgi:hypothetical protein